MEKQQPERLQSLDVLRRACRVVSRSMGAVYPGGWLRSHRLGVLVHTLQKESFFEGLKDNGNL